LPSWSADKLGDASGEVLVVFIHGGFWRERFTTDTIAPLAVACGQLGLWAWNIEYPRIGMAGGGWPGMALAIRDAVDGALEAAAGRPVALVGHSAGGQLALWAAGERPVSAVVSLAGVCDMEAAARAGIGQRAAQELLGAEPDADPDLYVAASPIRRLPLGVPTLLIHGDDDDRVPIEQSRTYAAAARAAGDDCSLSELSGVDHFQLIDPSGAAWAIVAARLEALAQGR
jgi:acetyl esterase/lipase